MVSKKKYKINKKAKNESVTPVRNIHVDDDESNRTSSNKKQSQEISALVETEISIVEDDQNNSQSAPPETILQTQPEQVLDIEPHLNKSQEENDRLEEYRVRNSHQTSESDKTAWKKDNPDSTLKHYKTLFVRGEIDHLPWEGYASQSSGYRQNEEQSENSIFNRIKAAKDDQTGNTS